MASKKYTHNAQNPSKTSTSPSVKYTLSPFSVYPVTGQAYFPLRAGPNSIGAALALAAAFATTRAQLDLQVHYAGVLSTPPAEWTVT
jgi:hypothetical protein